MKLAFMNLFIFLSSVNTVSAQQVVNQEKVDESDYENMVRTYFDLPMLVQINKILRGEHDEDNHAFWNMYEQSSVYTR